MIKFRELNFESIKEITQVARIHDDMPALWNSDYRQTEEELNKCINEIRSRKSSSDYLYLLAENESGNIIGMQWGEVMNSQSEKVVYISSVWVDENHRGSRVARQLNIRLEEWAKKLKINQISIDVHYNNAKMIQLAKLIGYKPGFVKLFKTLD